MLRPFLDRWRLCALLASAGLLAIAHAFETFGRLAPCELCLHQREGYWAALAVAAVFMVVVRLPGGPRWRAVSCWLLAAIFLGEAALAAYHAGVELKYWPGPQACTGAGLVTSDDLANLLKGVVAKAPRCDQPAWSFAGLSMAGWNAVAALILAVLSVLAAVRERAKP
jgi:disulfide bond formation protein DsbB